MKFPYRGIPMLAALILLPACSRHDDPAAPTRANFTLALDDYLARHGDLCLAMFDWPLDLTPAEAGNGARHALQMPVFEKLGLVSSTVVSVARTDDNPQGVVKRYALTDEGRKYYKLHDYKSRDGVDHPRDFCVAQITLDKLVQWQLDTHDAQHPTAVVSYTYRIAPAPWLQDADAQRVLPMVVRIVNGAGGHLQLHQGFSLTEHGWEATPGPV
ncbi:hypothetical protein [Solimonas terrae]|uniref:Uncharacterized protein n=1 Tax=Solimonas terrae TaxID=1396819 RepID=A0A6M2BVB2_9GAMM|nr:hypothetical protein [Solimonas terrae]NGY05887.1 hypothetical protein [Solimonas terrae]